MRNYYSLLLLILVSLPTLSLANIPVSGNATRGTQQFSRKDLASKNLEVLNTDGDLSLNPEQNANVWNPHTVGLTNASSWTITFINETEMRLKTSANEAGHIATGAWWTTSFTTRQKLPLYTSEPVQVAASFRAVLANADLTIGNEWLRIALACAVQRSDNSVVYTEMDLWDSPTALASPSGNIQQGGNIIYKGGDVVEYKIDQLSQNQWKSYQLNLTSRITNAWQLKSSDLLESVYFVVEAGGAVNVTFRADDLQIALLT
jgi:hypothetical protein